jgi:GTPase SAR1 family protein
MGCASRKSVIHSTEVITSSSNTDIHQETSTNKKRVHKLRPPNSTEERRLHHTTWSPTSSEHTVLPPTIEPSDQSKSSSNDFINVLLLGESGVGKSTFINAIVNYLKFDSIKDACSGQPIVLMPVSFLMTHGDHFQEQIVKFGNADPNEDHHHHGQSVTQCCRSYVFNVGTRNKLRLIDTPGMGDTRGLAQDDLNMQHILSFINNLSHLNAICILLKPNESKLNVVFRSYFTRLTSFLGENVRNNIIFCFTNTFFTPGDTAPLLKKTLHDLPIKNIPFDKSNSFCFDSESFRYLVARLNGMNFDKYQQDEYKQSWITSVNESNRFLQYICSELKPFPQENWQSIDHAQFQINRLIRPILETTRNILRNIILLKEEPSNANVFLDRTVISGFCPMNCIAR